MDSGRLPTFLVPGAPKCGTTTLYGHLARHPQIVMSDPKEPDIFRTHYGDASYLARCYAHSRGEQLRGDGTVNYLAHPVVAERFAQDVPDGRLVICLREPVERTISHYRQRVRRGYEARTMAKILDVGWEADILRFSGYHRCLTPYLAAFPLERFHFVLMSDLAVQPEQAVAGVFNFLGVETAPVDATEWANRGESSGNRTVRRAVATAQRLGITKPLPASLKKALRPRIARLHQIPVGSEDDVAVTDGDVERMREMFMPEIEALEQAIGLDLSAWKTAPSRSTR